MVHQISLDKNSTGQARRQVLGQGFFSKFKKEL
jgi:hypothetical protein